MKTMLLMMICLALPGLAFADESEYDQLAEELIRFIEEGNAIDPAEKADAISKWRVIERKWLDWESGVVEKHGDEENETIEEILKLSVKSRGLLGILAVLEKGPLPTKPPMEYAELKVRSGKVYKDVTVREVEPDGLRIMHSAGMAKLEFSELSVLVQQEHGYDPKKVAALKAERKEQSEIKSRKAARVIEADGQARCRQLAREKYPHDQEMQDYIYKNQLSSFRFMSSATPDEEVRAIALRKYPDDFSMQEYVYKNQASAKNYMASVASDAEVKGFAIRKYPADFGMQKYVYDNQLESKKFMRRQPPGGRKSKAVSKYPADYSMQKYVYENR